MAEFEWPCDRHGAHGPHDDCPGVLAHPATIIGGNYTTERPENF